MISAGLLLIVFISVVDLFYTAEYSTSKKYRVRKDGDGFYFLERRCIILPFYLYVYGSYTTDLITCQENIVLFLKQGYIKQRTKTITLK